MVMIKVNKEKETSKENEKSEIKLTPEYIQGKLFSFHDISHKFHLDTKSFAEHKALDFLYKSLGDFKDEISEKLMGYLGGKRIGKIAIDEIPSYSQESVSKLVSDIQDFAYELYEWAGEKKYCDIENISQSLSGVAAKTKYLLTLS